LLRFPSWVAGVFRDLAGEFAALGIAALAAAIPDPMHTDSLQRIMMWRPTWATVDQRLPATIVMPNFGRQEWAASHQTNQEKSWLRLVDNPLGILLDHLMRGSPTLRGDVTLAEWPII
jgi:hypothetical protein